MESNLHKEWCFRIVRFGWSLGLCLTTHYAFAQQPYQWKSVQIVGGGFVDGIVFHPTEKNLRYARTDIGGAYRWDESSHKWLPLLDWVPYKDTNLMGVESIAVDPADPNRLYLACGMYTNATSPNAAILRSDDRGATFQRADMPFKMGGNEDGRGNGERLAVDPNDGRVIYFGSRLAGLWRSEDRGVRWSKVASFPDVREMPATRPTTQTARPPRYFGFAPRSSGIVFILFDPRSGGSGKRSSIIYAGVSLMNRPSIFRSSDGGDTWQAVAGEPTSLRPSHGAWASDGVIYFSYGNAPGPSRMTDGAIWKFDTNASVWTDITPEKPNAKAGQVFGYGGVSVDASNPEVAIASTFNHPNGEEVFRTTDGGETWKPVFRAGGTYDYSIAPYVHRTPIHWLLDIQIDPCDPNHAVFTTGYGGWETFDLTDMDAGKPTHWSVMSKGIEEIVALQLISPPTGAHLISAIGDYGGFTHWDLDSPPPEGSSEPPRFGNTTGIAFAAKNPEVIVRVGILAGGPRVSGINLGYSLDGGETWQPSKTAPAPGSRQGSICVNADGSRWIWTPQRGNPWVTSDRGTTWSRCANLSANMRTVADPVDPMKFYALDLFNGQLFTSTDGGATFQPKPLKLPGGLPSPGDRGDDRGGQDQIYAAPGRTGDLWLATLEGLYHSTDSGETFGKIDGPSQLRAFGFGKGAPNGEYPALYLIATIANQPGIYRSDDGGSHWVRINDDQHQYGLLLQVTGDPRVFGRVYVGTHGRGILCGDPTQ
jgi:photosystem II stability/assembly factor-like uncharacterized protein